MLGLFGKPLLTKTMGSSNISHQKTPLCAAVCHAAGRLNLLRFFQISQHGINVCGLKRFTSRWKRYFFRGLSLEIHHK